MTSLEEVMMRVATYYVAYRILTTDALDK